MQNFNDPNEFDDLVQSQANNAAANEPPSPLSLKLVSKKIPAKYCEYKISNTPQKMLNTETTSISGLGLTFQASQSFGRGTLMRVWIEMPDYWARKSRHVGYRHTDAPTFFQILARVVNCEETGKRGNKFQIMCQNLNLDPVDELVLNDYLGCGANG